MVTVAASAGLCFGVKRAVERVLDLAKDGEVITLGALAHNAKLAETLSKAGVRTIASLDELQESDKGATVVIRAHGEPAATFAELNRRGIKYADCTCPSVAKIQRLAAREAAAGRTLIIVGDGAHPEVKGIKGYAGENAIVVGNLAEAEKIKGGEEYSKGGGAYSVVSQTTHNAESFAETARAIEKNLTNVKVFNTVCEATETRQKEAAELARECDTVIVLGDGLSSNAKKLYEICLKVQRNTFFVSDIKKLLLQNIKKGDRIGITAGASVPPETIREALLTVSDFEEKLPEENSEVKEVAASAPKERKSFAQMLDESIVTLHKGAVVKGTVISVMNGEVNVNLGFKSDGIVQKGDFSSDPHVDPADVVKPGDVIEVYVVHVNDKDGNVLLSRRLVEAKKSTAEIERAAETGEPLKGKIVEVIKGGVIANINGVKAFVPSSQVSERFVEDLSTLLGREFDFTILQYDKAKRRVVAGRKALVQKEIKERKDKVFSSIEVGSRVEGTVSRITGFGAFIDIGGVDGLVHISQLSWGRVRKVSSVVNVGDKVSAVVLAIDREKEKISLTLRDVLTDPWSDIYEKYPIGSIVTGKIVRLVSFGAFVELEPNLDGLIHISQISDQRIESPAEVLQVGDLVDVKIVALDPETRRVSLSKRQADAEMYGDDYYEEEYAGEYAEEQPDGEVAGEEIAE